MGAKFVWSGLQKEVRKWAAACLDCQQAKLHRHMKSSLETFLIPERHFDHIHVDLVGLLSPSYGFNYLLTMVDRTTR